jgi:hypothetical protein
MSRAVRLVWWLLTLPATVAHEATHCLAAAPWAREIQVRIRPGRNADAVITFRPATPAWAKRAAELAPLSVGLVALAVAAAWWAHADWWLPATLLDQLTALYLCYSWALYAVLSSGADLRGGLGAGGEAG